MNLHGSCVAVDGRGMLILGPSGTGKSALALQMMALGARLVADDRVDLMLRGDDLVASCPAPIRGLIEARGVGILQADPVSDAVVHLAVDLGATGGGRLPARNEIVLLGRKIDLVHGAASAHFPAAMLLYLRGGRVA